MKKILVSSRTRNFGFGFTTTTSRDADTGMLVIDTVGAPQVQGSRSAILNAVEESLKYVGQGVGYRVQLYVAGQPVRDTDLDMPDDLRSISGIRQFLQSLGVTPYTLEVTA